MKPIRTVFRIWYDELTDLFRDKGILIFILFVPLAYPLLYSWVYTNEVVREVPAAVVDDSRTPQSRAFIRMVDATPDVAVAAHCTTVAEAEELLRRREVFGIIPQLTPNIISTVIYRFDINIKDATTLGIVGAGGIGAALIQCINSRRWTMVGSFILAMIVLMLIIEFASTRIRGKLARGQ